MPRPELFFAKRQALFRQGNGLGVLALLVELFDLRVEALGLGECRLARRRHRLSTTALCTTDKNNDYGNDELSNHDADLGCNERTSTEIRRHRTDIMESML